MRNRLPLGLYVVAICQILPPLVLPPATLQEITPVVWILAVALSAILGVSLLRRRAWSRLATIFVQGFNIIVRLLYIIGHATRGARPGNPADVGTISVFLLSMILSGIVLYYVDQPDIQVIMQ